MCLLGNKEKNVLFNDTLNTFYLWLYTIRHRVKNYSDSHKGNSLLPGYCFCLAARVLLYTPSHREDSTYHCFCFTSRGTLPWMRIAQWVCHDGSIQRWRIYSAQSKSWLYFTKNIYLRNRISSVSDNVSNSGSASIRYLSSIPFSLAQFKGDWIIHAV